MTLSRFRQISAAIRTRQFFDSRQQKSMISWNTRVLASFIAGGYMTDGKHGNPALEEATSLAIDSIEEALIKDAKKNQQAAKVKEPAIGSYERFMSAFGGKIQG